MSGKLKKEFQTKLPFPSWMDEAGEYFDAIKCGDRDTVIEFLDKYSGALAEKTLNDMTPLMWAAKHGQAGTAELLLDRGAAIDDQDREGVTALMHAAFEGHETTVDLLLDRNADIHQKGDTGWTALMCAASSGEKNIVEVLLEKGASVEDKSNSGRKASDIAYEQANADVARSEDYTAIAVLLEQWPEKERLKKLAAEIADYSPALKRDIPALRPFNIPRK